MASSISFHCTQDPACTAYIFSTARPKIGTFTTRPEHRVSLRDAYYSVSSDDDSERRPEAQEEEKEAEVLPSESGSLEPEEQEILPYASPQRNWAELPDDILLRILVCYCTPRERSTVSRVCKGWRHSMSLVSAYARVNRYSISDSCNAFSKVKSLVMEAEALDDLGCKELIKVLKKSKQIHGIDMTVIPTQCKPITTQRLFSNIGGCLSYIRFSIAPAKSPTSFHPPLSCLLPRGFPMVYVNLSDCRLEDDDVFPVVDAIGESKSLQVLILDNNRLTSACVSDLCNTRGKMKTLSFSYNPMGNDVADAVCGGGLEKGNLPCLENLFLTGCHLGRRGIKQLRALVQSRRTKLQYIAVGGIASDTISDLVGTVQGDAVISNSLARSPPNSGDIHNPLLYTTGFHHIM